jgi:hypothetical protein
MTAHRITAALIALAALIGVGWQFQLNGSKPDLAPWLDRAWDMLRYFTIITNLLVVGLLGGVALGRKVGANAMLTITLSIIMVGIIYRLLLAPEVPLQVPNWYPDFLMHVAVPVLVPLWWLAFADKSLRLAQMPLWLSLPAVYCVYALTRGLITGSYPYFFFDIGRFGFGTVLLYCAGLVAVFALCGLVLWAVARAMSRRSA